MDAANIDLKAFTDDFYRKRCLGDLQTCLDTIQYVRHETDVWLELTTLLIPGENDSDRELKEMCSWVYKELGPDVPMHFTAFHPDFKMRDIPATPPETLSRARQIALDAGIHYAYTGNTHDKSGASTYCANCQKCLIGRDWYVLSDWHLQDGACEFCGSPCAGHFDAVPGDWGPRRQPIHIS